MAFVFYGSGEKNPMFPVFRPGNNLKAGIVGLPNVRTGGDDPLFSPAVLWGLSLVVRSVVMAFVIHSNERLLPVFAGWQVNLFQPAVQDVGARRKLPLLHHRADPKSRRRSRRALRLALQPLQADIPGPLPPFCIAASSRAG